MGRRRCGGCTRACRCRLLVPADPQKDRGRPEGRPEKTVRFGTEGYRCAPARAGEQGGADAARINVASSVVDGLVVVTPVSLKV